MCVCMCFSFTSYSLGPTMTQTTSDSQHKLFDHKSQGQMFLILFVSLFPSYLEPSLPRILPESLIRSLRPEQMHLFTGLLCNVCNLFIRNWLILYVRRKCRFCISVQVINICHVAWNIFISLFLHWFFVVPASMHRHAEWKSLFPFVGLRLD